MQRYIFPSGQNTWFLPVFTFHFLMKKKKKEPSSSGSFCSFFRFVVVLLKSFRNNKHSLTLHFCWIFLQLYCAVSVTMSHQQQKKKYIKSIMDNFSVEISEALRIFKLFSECHKYFSFAIHCFMVVINVLNVWIVHLFS